MKAQGFDSTVEFTIQLTEPGKLAGNGSAKNGVLRALGAVIAKFAEENFQ
nr:K816 [uncultured bacterium]